MLKSNTFSRKTKAGRIKKEVREIYLRDDIYCGAAACKTCDSSTSRAPLDVASPLLILDTNVLLHQIDLLENSAIDNAVLLSVVLDEVKNKNMAVYNRLRALSTNPLRKFYVFSNQFHKDTFVKRMDGETPNDYNDRAIRVATQWYQTHLGTAATVLLITNDRDNKRRAGEEGISADTIQSYVKSLGQPELLDLLVQPASESEDTVMVEIEDLRPSKRQVVYQEHKPMSEITSGLHRGIYHQGKLRVNRYNPFQAYVGSESIGDEIIIYGRQNMNRAFDGDIVAVELLRQDQWHEEKNLSIADEEDEEEDDVHLAPSSADDAPRTTNLVSDSATDMNSTPSRPSGRVVGIIKRNWHSYCGSLEPMSMPAGTGSFTSALFVSKDRRIPKIRIQTRQLENLLDKRIIVAVDSWDRQSRYPSGHYVRVIGEIGDRDTESEVVLIENDINSRPFSSQVLACLPPLPWSVSSEDVANSIRQDLRSLRVFSVDPPSCKDIDDDAPILGLKPSLASSTSQLPQVSSPLEHAEDTASQDSNSDVARTPPSKSCAITSAIATPCGSHPIPAPLNLSPHSLSGTSTPPIVLPGSSSARSVLENTGTTNPSSPVNLPNATKEEDITSFPGRRPSPSLTDTGVRGIARGGLSGQPSSSIPLVSGSMASGNGTLGVVPSVSDMAKRTILGTDERPGNSSMVQSLVSPLSNRMMLPQTAKANDGGASVDSSNPSESAGIPGRVFSPSMVSGMQWRPGSSFQNQNDPGQFRGRTEIAPDMREKYLQRLQQVQQQGHSNLLGVPPLAGGNLKHFSAQQAPLMQQFNSQSSSLSIQSGLGLGGQAPGFNSVTAASLQQQQNPIQQQSSQQALATNVPKDGDIGNAKVEEQQPRNLPDDSNSEAVPTSGLAKNLMNEDEMKTQYAIDSPAAVSGSLTEPAQVIRDVDLSPGQPLQSNQSSSGLGVIGRRSVTDFGAIGDNLSVSMNTGGMHDQLYNLQMLEAAYYKIPQPKDSERARSYTPKHPAATPASYPQVQAPIVNNPAFWERISLDGYGTGTDTLFFAFYYQQNTYQQYLAAKELKKQSWRYHRKYNTWFQRHEEPKIATDEFEQGTYVYFDFHIANDEHQHGWCQRIKTEFTFEYNYLEDELIC